ncbi:MAG: MerR family DNA-binding transcriptional regulator [Albidovulum sp.]
MSNELMSIRAMCDAFDVTPRTLRFYEQKELLSPIREGQKRLFTRRDRARLTLILRGRKFGISLEEIRQLLDLYDMSAHKDDQLAKVIEAARRRLAEMKRQRDELDLSISELSAHIENGEQLFVERKKQSAA